MSTLHPGHVSDLTFISPKPQGNDDLGRKEKNQMHSGTSMSYTCVFQEREQSNGPEDGTDGSDDVFLGRRGTICGPDAVKSVERRRSNIRVYDTCESLAARKNGKCLGVTECLKG